MLNLKIEDEDIEEIAKKINDAIFEGKDSVNIKGEDFEIEKYSPSGVRHVKIEPYLFLEQNPNKDSWHAKQAKKGKEILWVMKDYNYYARIMDDKFTLLEKNNK
ncbi:MAG: hypothetical protein GF329_19630 [Candidatus Lokiarchaeota archaeon]|nr:hypothetical protein [Candidatus Lokiarchaeota archaeon]